MTDVEGKVAIGLIRDEGEFLLLQRSEETSSSGKWCFPGGKLEGNETPEEAVLRELKEETDLSCSIIRKADPYFGEGELGTWKIYPFLVKTDSREVTINFEHSSFKWVELDEISVFDTLGDLKAIQKLELLSN